MVVLTDKQYWDFNHINNKNQTYESIREIESLLSDSVKSRLLSDVPIGAFLSGGLDSSAVVALLSKFQQTKIKTFTVGYNGQNNISEEKYARLVANQYKTEHHVY